jgi:probable O-glycosylation ligase (exosortase A-associated)
MAMTRTPPPIGPAPSPVRESGGLKLESSPTGRFGLPFLFVLGYLVVEFGRPQSWVPALGAIRPGLLMYVAGILSLLFSRRIYVPRAAWPVLLFLAQMVLHVPFAFNPRVAYNLTWDLGIFLLGAVLPMMTFTDSLERVELLVRVWVWLHLPLAAHAMTHKGVGLGSFLGDENDLALAFNMILAYAIALLLTAKTVVRKFVYLGVVMALLSAVTATESRGGFVGLVAVASIVWIRSSKKLLALVLVCVLAGFIAVVTPSSYWREMQTIETADNRNDTGWARLYAWRIAWRMFLDHPVFGVGPANYPRLSADYESRGEMDRGKHVWGRAAHSLYFTLIPEHGVLGTVLFCWMVIQGVVDRSRVARRLRRVIRAPDARTSVVDVAVRLRQLLFAIDAALVAYLVTGAFLSVLYYPHVWLLTAISVAVVRVGLTIAPNAPETTGIDGSGTVFST